jgi:hypothetical protein
VQVVVQLLAGLCGVGQVSTVRNLLNYAARLQLSRHPTTLDSLNLYTSLTTSHINWSLPPLSLATTLGTTIIALAPTALWVGALTPIVDFVDIKSALMIATPAYTEKTEKFWRITAWYIPKGIEPVRFEQRPQGLFTYRPIVHHFNFFLNAGSTASNANGGPALVRKSDNSNYTYYGRSYGVGSSVALLDQTMEHKYPRIARYSFEETGYTVNWICAYKQSVKGLTTKDSRTFIATSPYSNGNTSFVDLSGYAQVVASQSWSTTSTGDLSTCSAYRSAAQVKQQITIVATEAYKTINATQCNGTATPTRFLVDVDVTNRVISVAPQQSKDVEDIECTHTQSLRAMDALSALSMVSTTSYTSAIGDMIQNNIYNVLQQPRETNEPNEVKKLTLRGISETLEALADQYLSSNAAAQLMLANDTKPAAIRATTRAFRIGQSGFIYAVFVTNLAVLMLVVIEALRTRFWHGLPKLNFADVKSVIVASAFDGAELWRKAADGYSRFEGTWAGEADSRITGAIEVQLFAVQAGVGLKTM